MQNVSITVVVTDISADSERISLADIEVYSYIVTSVDTVHTPESTKPASAHIGKSHIVRVVRTCKDSHLVVTEEMVEHSPGLISSVQTVSACYVTEPTVFHTLFYSQVDNGFLLPVVDSGQAGKVRFSVYDLQLFDDVHGQVFSSHFGVVREELFTVYQYFGNLFSRMGYFSLAIHLDARQFFQQILDDRIGLCFIRVGIKLHCVFFNYHFGSFAHHYGFLQQYIVATQ